MKTLRDGVSVEISMEEFRRIHGVRLPLVLKDGPLHPGARPNTVKRHPSNCICGDCLTAGQHYADHVKARQLEDL